MRENQIVSLAGITSNNAALQYLNLRGNQISEMDEIKKLETLPKLTALNLIGPLCPHYSALLLDPIFAFAHPCFSQIILLSRRWVMITG